MGYVALSQLQSTLCGGTADTFLSPPQASTGS